MKRMTIIAVTLCVLLVATVGTMGGAVANQANNPRVNSEGSKLSLEPVFGKAIYEDPVHLTAILTHSDGTPINGQVVTFQRTLNPLNETPYTEWKAVGQATTNRQGVAELTTKTLYGWDGYYGFRAVAVREASTDLSNVRWVQCKSGTKLHAEELVTYKNPFAFWWYNIQGTLTDQDGYPAPKQEIKIWDSPIPGQGKLLATVQTDTNGRFSWSKYFTMWDDTSVTYAGNTHYWDASARCELHPF